MISKQILIQKLKIKTAQNHVVVICVLFMLLSMLIIGTYMTAVVYSNSFHKTYDKMQMYTEKTVENMEQSFDFIASTALAVATSKSIMNWVDAPSVFEENAKGYYERVYELKNEVQHILAYSSAWKNNDISYISVFCDDKLLMYSYTKPLPENIIIESSQKAYETVKTEQLGSVKNIQPLLGDDKIYHVRTLRHGNTDSKPLIIIVATDEYSLRRHYNTVNQRDNSKTYLIDEDAIIFSSSEEQERGKKCDQAIMQAIAQNRTELRIDNRNYMCVSERIEGTQLTFVNLMPRSEITKQALSGMPMFILIALILCLVLFCVGIIVSLNSTRFIRDLTYGMGQIKEKNYDVKMPTYHNYAIDLLGESFNSMTESMKVLVKDTYESKIMLQEMQLEFLQQQVNPHFLFNILLTIQIKAKMCSEDVIYRMLESLSGFLRAGLYSSNNTFTTFGEELQCAKFYLYLQQQRFEEKLEYRIEAADSLLKWKIPRLTIEPIIENAIMHGVENFEKPVTVIITAQDCGEYIEITVMDNGAGFCVETLDLSDEVIEPQTEFFKMTRDKIGLKNTNARLKLLYGEAYALQINSAIGKGTTIIIRIPREKGGNEACIESL